ncbi:PAS domain S-box protein [Bdellovibrionota bacterium]
MKSTTFPKMSHWLGVSVAGIISVDDDKHIAFWNKGAEKIFQYAPDETIGKSITMLLPEENVTKEEGFITEKLLNEGFIENYRTTCVRKDGKHIPVSVTISGVKDDSGTLIGGTYVFRDITVPLKVDAEMRRLAETIRCVSDLVLISDLKNQIIYVNPAVIERLGYSKEELIGQDAKCVVSPEFQEDGEKIYRNTLEKGSWKGEIENITKSGERLSVFLSTAVVRDSNGNPIALTGMGKDISKLKEAEQKIRENAQKLEEINKTLRETQKQLIISEKQAAMGVLAAGIAHEIGNPLSSISSLVQLVSRKSEDKNVQSTMEQITKHVSRISKIIRGLVDLARPRSSSDHGAQIDQIVSYAIKIATFTRPNCKIPINISLDQDLPLVKGHRADILQAIINVVVNAIDAVDQTDGSIQINGRRNGSGVVVEVIDNGTGVPTEDQTKVFQPFFTTKEIGSGAGLGLSTSYNILRSLGGRIDINSNEGEGTKVSLCFPHNKECSYEQVPHPNS